ncbi:MAG: hypothetical protein ACYDBH_01420 [Acidobacteriaceae bacterium]
MSDADEIQTLHALNDSQAAEIARLTAELAALHSGDNLRAILDDDTTAMMREIEHDKAQIVSLTAEIERVRADATRYRWLRHSGHKMIGADRGLGPEWPYGDELDVAIDAARGTP